MTRAVQRDLKTKSNRPKMGRPFPVRSVMRCLTKAVGYCNREVHNVEQSKPNTC